MSEPTLYLYEVVLSREQTATVEVHATDSDEACILAEAPGTCLMADWHQLSVKADSVVEVSEA